MKFSKTLRFKLLFGFLMLTLPLLAFLIYNNFYAIKVVRNQVAQSNANLASLYMGQIDRNLEEVDKYLYNMAAMDTDLLILEQPREENQEYELAKIRLFNTISKDIANYKTIDKFLIYTEPNDDLLMTRESGETFQEWESARNELTGIFHEKRLQNQSGFEPWFIVPNGANHYLCQIIKVGDVYVGAWVNVKKLLVPLNLIDFGDQGKAILASGNYEPLEDEPFLNDNHIRFQNRNGYMLAGNPDKYLVIGEKSNKGGFSLLAIIPDSKVLEGLPYLQQIAAFISIGSIVILPVVFLFLRRVIFIPINRIVVVMRKIKNGNMDVRIAQSPVSAEFELMNETFNGMIQQIQELKINVYEEQLNSQKAELKHLQLQINPHFFLNSLNIIYNLAQLKNYALIQEMSISLVHYFRFMFRSNMTFVNLGEEIEHTRNYLRIQEMRFPGNLTFDIQASETLSKCFVPPLLIQTFVENAIKHAVTLDKPIHIHVGVVPDEAAPDKRIKVNIRDTGQGFPETVLAQLQSESDKLSEHGEHIGIWNVKRRLQLLYRDQTQITFANSHEGGASVEICLPLNKEG